MDKGNIRFKKYDIYPERFGCIESDVREFIYDVDKLLIETLSENFPDVEFKLWFRLFIPDADYSYYDVVIKSTDFDEEIDHDTAENEQLGYVDSDNIIESAFNIIGRQTAKFPPCIHASRMRYQLTLSSVGRPNVSRAKFYAIKNSSDYSGEIVKGFNELKKKYSFLV